MQKGFTLIELMIIVPIIGILAVAASPVYKNDTGLAQMSEFVLASSLCRTAITEASQMGLRSAPAANGFGCNENAAGPVSQYV